MALPRLIDTLLHSCLLEGPCYDCLWRGNKGTYKSTFEIKIISSAKHRWPDLWHYICYVQSTQRITLTENKEFIMSDDNAAEIWNTFFFYNVTLRSKDIQIITL